MKETLILILLALSVSPLHGAQVRPAPIRQVEIRDRVFYVKGKPFFPLMAWLQDARNFPTLRECAMNATAGYSPGSSGTKHVAEYLELVQQAGLYGVMPFDPRLKDQPALLGYIHDDEPDLLHQESDAVVEPRPHQRVNPSTPLWRLLDGDVNSWSVLDPLDGASLTIRLPQPVTVEGLGVAVTVSKGLAMPAEVAFETGGRRGL